ncbi:MAG: tetratricopeptide repeat protein [Rhizomicrobium sp.]
MVSDDPIGDAVALIEGGRAPDAAALLQALLDANRGGLLARLTLVRALLAAGDVASALEAARDAVALNPQVAQAVIALGDALLAAGLLPVAIAEFQRALRLDPDSDEARRKLGLAWLEAGEADKALAQFESLDDVAELVARAQAMRTQPRSDAGYVRHLFDQFSADYDQRMRGQLRYRAPEILRELADLVMPGARGLTVLDLGCGTGFAAQAFVDRASAIDGIDLSPAMIAKARARGLYRDLAVADIETALTQGGTDYDLVIAADTLVYLGDLAATFAGVARRLRPGGFFLFTVESGSDDFALGPKRRWRHSEAYLRKLAADSGLDVSGIVACAPRSEANAPVEGLAVALAKMS